MSDRWKYKGYEILFENCDLYIDGADIDDFKDELYGETYTRERIKTFIDEYLDGEMSLSEYIDRRTS